MTDPRNDVADIAWLKQLAEEGARGPMRGGAILMAAGLIFGGASLIHGLVLIGVIAMAPQAFSILWMAATALFFLILIVLIARSARRGGVQTAIDRATRAVWSAVGWGIFALFSSIGVVSSRIGEASIALLQLSPSIIMAFYGLGWAVSAAMTRSKAIGGLAVASFIAAPLLAAVPDQATQYFAYAGALFVLMAAPGFLLMRQARG